MKVLNTMMKYKPKRNTNEICAGIFGTVRGNCFNNDKCMDIARIKTTQQYCKNDDNKLLISRILSSSTFSKRISFVQQRYYCTSSEEDLPKLTDLPIRMQPRIFGDIKFLLITYLAIKPQLDKDFSLADFVKTSDKVAYIVSNKLAASDYDALEEMVTPDVFSQIKRNLPFFTEKQREELVMQLEDIAISYTYDIEITENSSRNEKYLQITTVHHVLKGVEEFRKIFRNFNPLSMIMQPVQQEGAPKPINPIEEIKKKRSLIKGFVVNCRFLRTFNLETGTAGDWIINGINIARIKKED